MTKDTFLFLLLTVVLSSLFCFGWGRHEAFECQQWAEQAKEQPGFYYAEWQKQQCGL